MTNWNAASGSISAIMDLIARSNGSVFVSEPISSRTREFLQVLLDAHGYPIDESTMRFVSDRDLCVLYSTTRGDYAAGANVAKRIAAKCNAKAPNPLLDPTTIGYPARVEYTSTLHEVTGEARYQRYEAGYPPPSLPAPAQIDTGKYALKTELQQLRSDMNIDFRARVGDVRADMDAKHVQLQTNLTDTLLKFTEALPEVVKAQVLDALKALTPVTLTVALPNTAPVPLGMVHRKTATIIQMLAAGVNVYLHGPAGSGKTTAGRKCAEAFGLPFYFAAKVESEYMLLGFKDARGETVRTQFREAYEHGGVFLFDELDGSSPSAVVALNAALANGICPFPDGIIMRHENFKCIGAGNTKLGGASRQYVGRTQLDAASVDRFAFVEFGYDDGLETALATNADWCQYVQAARNAVADRGLPHLITPRATYDGCKLLEAGVERAEVEAAVLWKGLDADTVAQIVRTMEGM